MEDFCFSFIHWLCRVFLAACRLSLAAVSWGYSSLGGTGASSRRLLLLQSTGSKHPASRSCSTQSRSPWLRLFGAPGPAVWHVGSRSRGSRASVALQHVQSSRMRGWVRAPCIGRQILIYCTTREVPPRETSVSCFHVHYSWGHLSFPL